MKTGLQRASWGEEAALHSPPGAWWRRPRESIFTVCKLIRLSTNRSQLYSMFTF